MAGLAGWGWRWGTGRARAYGAAFPAGTFFAQAVRAYGFRLHYHPAVAIFGLIGAALLTLLIRHSPWPQIVGWMAVIVVAGALVYGALLDAFVGTTFVGTTFVGIPFGQ